MSQRKNEKKSQRKKDERTSGALKTMVKAEGLSVKDVSRTVRSLPVYRNFLRGSVSTKSLWELDRMIAAGR